VRGRGGKKNFGSTVTGIKDEGGHLRECKKESTGGLKRGGSPWGKENTR